MLRHGSDFVAEDSVGIGGGGTGDGGVRPGGGEGEIKGFVQAAAVLHC